MILFSMQETTQKKNTLTMRLVLHLYECISKDFWGYKIYMEKTPKWRHLPCKHVTWRICNGGRWANFRNAKNYVWKDVVLIVMEKGDGVDL